MAKHSKDIAHMRAEVLAQALRLIPKEGLDAALLGMAVEKAGYPPSFAPLLFADGVRDLLSFWHAQNDAAFGALAPARLKKYRRIRDKITQGVVLRLAQDKPHRDSARVAFDYWSQPPHWAQAAQHIFATADAIWRAAGDTSLDINYYSKRAILAGVYAGTYAVWVKDDSARQKRTRDFLDARINTVMQFEGFKARAQDWMKDMEAQMPDIMGALARWRFEGKPARRRTSSRKSA